MSAYHEALPHGAGLIMLSLAYFGWLAEHHVCDDRLVDLARFLGREDASRPEEFLEAGFPSESLRGGRAEDE